MTLYLLVSDSVKSPCQLDRVRDVCACLIEALGPTLGTAVVDGYTDSVFESWQDDW